MASCVKPLFTKKTDSRGNVRVERKPAGSELGDATQFPPPTKFGRVYRDSLKGCYIGGGNTTRIEKMADYHGPLIHPKAKKEHRCIYCGGPIVTGEQYVQQEGFYEGKAYRNRYHDECYKTCGEECAEYGEWEFTPYSGEMPERIKLLMASPTPLSDGI